MVDISDRVAQIRAMVEKGDYFCVNRARQYGKTTTLAALRRALAGDFEVVSLDFQALGHASFATEGSFVSSFSRIVLDRWDADPVPLPAREDLQALARDQTRTDVIVDYLGERFVVELKIWRGRSRHEEGEEQLRGYLERFGLSVGYLFSFNFNRTKGPGLSRVVVGDSVLWEETV